MVFEHTLELDPLKLAFERFRILTIHQQETLKTVLKQLLSGEPVQYVLGETDFFGLKFKVNNQVLIPRPETEELVAWILESYKQQSEANIRILDIGTGSGCIAIALAKNLPAALVEAMDVSPGALELAIENNRINNTEVNFFYADIFEYSLSENGFDVIVSNPPYVTQSEKDTLAPNVIAFEPHGALFAPANDDLLFYKTIGLKAMDALRPGGKLFFEINPNKASELVVFMETIGFKDVQIRNDLSGKERMLCGMK